MPFGSRMVSSISDTTPSRTRKTPVFAGHPVGAVRALEVRVGEVDGAVGGFGDVVGGVERVVLEVRREGRALPGCQVVAGYAALVVCRGDEGFAVAAQREPVAAGVRDDGGERPGRGGVAQDVRGLDVLLAGAVVHVGQQEGLGAGDVGDRASRAAVPIRPGRLAPALRLDAALLAQQGQEDLGLLLAAPGQRPQPPQDFRAVGLGAAVEPDTFGAAVVVLDDVLDGRGGPSTRRGGGRPAARRTFRRTCRRRSRRSSRGRSRPCGVWTGGAGVPGRSGAIVMTSPRTCVRLLHFEQSFEGLTISSYLPAHPFECIDKYAGQSVADARVTEGVAETRHCA